MADANSNTNSQNQTNLADLEETTPATSFTGPKIGLHLDIESLDTGPRSVVTQIALWGVDLESGEPLNHFVWSHIPIQPQLDLVRPRTVSADTIFWWMKQGTAAQDEFEKSLVNDFGALPILMRHLTSGFNLMTHDGRDDYILIARGPQFDCVNVESLYIDCGLRAPWKYDRIVDLRTLLRESGITREEEKSLMSKDYIAHRALDDCKHQANLYFEARKILRSQG